MKTFTTLYGQKKEIPDQDIILRPTAYAVIVQQDDILLLKVKSTGKWFLPGGGVEKNEDLAEGLRREVLEETGLTVEVGEPLLKKEHLFYYDPLDEAYHMFITFFRCRVVQGTLHDPAMRGEETKQPQWVKLRDVRDEDVDEVLHDIFHMVKTHHD